MHKCTFDTCIECDNKHNIICFYLLYYNLLLKILVECTYYFQINQPLLLKSIYFSHQLSQRFQGLTQKLDLENFIFIIPKFPLENLSLLSLILHLTLNFIDL